MGSVATSRIVGLVLGALVAVGGASCASRGTACSSSRSRPIEKEAARRVAGSPLQLGAGGWLGLSWGISPDAALVALRSRRIEVERQGPHTGMFPSESGPIDVDFDTIRFDRDGWRVSLDFVGFRLGRVSLGRPVSGADEVERVLRELTRSYGAPSFVQDADCHQQPVRATWTTPGTFISVSCYVTQSGWSVGQTVETVPQTRFTP